jgi:RNA polymerase primary sigma factor
VKELVVLAQEQGYLTYGDIKDALPDSVVSPTSWMDLHEKLPQFRNRVVDKAEVDAFKQPEPEEVERQVAPDNPRMFPVRMYSEADGDK